MAVFSRTRRPDIASFSGARALPARLAAMRGADPDKVALFYPQLGSRLLVDRCASPAGPTRRTCSSLIRSFDSSSAGAHALSLWPYERVRPGDVFAGHEYHVPPGDPRWVLLVARLPPNRVWLRVAGLRGSRRGAGSLKRGDEAMLYEVEPADIGAPASSAGRRRSRRRLEQGRRDCRSYRESGSWTSLASTVCESVRAGLSYPMLGHRRPSTSRARDGYRTGQLMVGASRPMRNPPKSR